jgi:hypothetical protein
VALRGWLGVSSVPWASVLSQPCSTSEASVSLLKTLVLSEEGHTLMTSCDLNFVLKLPISK